MYLHLEEKFDGYLIYIYKHLPTMEKKTRKVVIIGAGASCLCALRHFSADPGYDVVAYEAASTLGGIWNYLSQGTHSLKPILKNNPSTDSTPFSESFGPLAITTVVTRENMSGYLNDYAGHYDLMRYFKFRHQVLSVNPLKDGEVPTSQPQFMITVVDLETEISEEIIADIVLICTGHDTKPYQPSLNNIDNFQGIVTHSSEYSGPETYKNLSVVVVGQTSIAREVICELLSVAKKIIFVPTPQSQDEHYYSPGGLSFELEAFLTNTVPGKILNYFLTSIKGFCCSAPVPQIDLPETFSEILQTHSIVAFKEDSIVLPNGKNVLIDAVILATGFDFDFPFLTSECQMQVSPGKVCPLYRQLIHTQFQTLAFVGLHNVLPYLVTGTEVQIRFYKAFLDGKVTLPPVNEMLEEETGDECGGAKLYWAHKMVKQVWPYTYPPTCANTTVAPEEQVGSGQRVEMKRLAVQDCTISPDRISQQFSSSVVRRISPLPEKSYKETKRRSSAKIVQFKVGDKVLRKSLSFSGSVEGSSKIVSSDEHL